MKFSRQRIVKTYLMSLKCSDASSTLRAGIGVSTSGCNKLPHLDGLVQTSRYEVLAIWCEGDGVNRVLVSIWALETLNKVASSSIPDTNALVERSSSDVFGIWGNGNGSDAILNAKSEDVLTGFDIPEADSAISTTGSNGASIAGKVERVDILLMAGERVSDCSRSDIPHSDLLVLRTGGKVSSIRTKADASDVEITNRINRLILESEKFCARDNIEDLCRAIAACGNKFSVVAESDTAYNALVLEGMDKIHIEDAGYHGVKNSKPICLDLLLMSWQALEIQLSKRISNTELSSSVIRDWVSDLWGCSRSRVWVWHLLIQLRCGGATWSTIQARAFAGTGRRSGWGRLRSVTIGCRALNVASTLKRRCLRWRWALETRSRLGHLMWGTLLIGLWWWRRKTWSSLSSLTSHYSSEEIAWAMSNGWRGLGRTSMLWGSANACWARIASSGFELTVKTGNFLVISINSLGCYHE
jgi:hypothetical protein